MQFSQSLDAALRSLAPWKRALSLYLVSQVQGAPFAPAQPGLPPRPRPGNQSACTCIVRAWLDLYTTTNQTLCFQTDLKSRYYEKVTRSTHQKNASLAGRERSREKVTSDSGVDSWSGRMSSYAILIGLQHKKVLMMLGPAIAQLSSWTRKRSPAADFIRPALMGVSCISNI